VGILRRQIISLSRGGLGSADSVVDITGKISASYTTLDGRRYLAKILAGDFQGLNVREKNEGVIAI